MIHIAHLINPVSDPASPELIYAQPITFQSMCIAAKNTGSDITVELMTAQYPEDIPIIPQCFRQTKNLERSVADYGSFTRPVKLPLLKALLDRLYYESTAEYLIYTNADIALQPHFYLEVARRIKGGLDAFIINRRRIEDRYRKVEQLPLMYKERGYAHPGFDCFVFHRSLYPKFHLENVCIGIPFIEITFSQNLFCYAKNFRLFDNDFLTFHIGMEIFKKRDAQYVKYNRDEYKKAIRKMWGDLDSRKFPWGQRNFFYRMTRWLLHPAIPISLALQLEWRRLMLYTHRQ